MGSRSIAIALLILDLGARRGWVDSTMPRPLYPRERPGTHYTGGWEGWVNMYQLEFRMSAPNKV
jgi:hypothetical protein